jgi:hypothetical protein
VHSEAEVVGLLQLAQRHKVPVTFRTAGTSLSGQAITDSILIKVGGGERGRSGSGPRGWGGMQINFGGRDCHETGSVVETVPTLSRL